MKSIHMLQAQLRQQDVKQKFKCIMIASNSSQTNDSPKDLAIFQLQQFNFPNPPRGVQEGSKGCVTPIWNTSMGTGEVGWDACQWISFVMHSKYSN